MRIDKVDYLTFDKIHAVLRAKDLTQTQKQQFLQYNSTQIHQLMEGKVNAPAFRAIMKNRPLRIFRPLKNSFTKAGDKKILAEVLGIEPVEVDDYISELSESIAEGELKDISKDEFKTVGAYVFRHGKKQEVLNFLDFELSSAVQTLRALYKLLSYDTGGVADYFARPIHRLDNRTMVDLYKVIDKNLDRAKSMGNISEEDRQSGAEWALIQIYSIQNNQKLRNAYRLKQKLESM